MIRAVENGITRSCFIKLKQRQRQELKDLIIKYEESNALMLEMRMRKLLFLIISIITRQKHVLG